MSIDRVTLAPDSRIVVREDADATRKDAESSSFNNTASTVLRSVTLQETVEPEQPKEFVIDRIVRHDDHYNGRLYRVRWYGYAAKDDTLEPAYHLPNNFVVRY